MLWKINNTHIGFNNVRTQDILTHLCNRFGKVSTLELEEVEKTLTELFNTIAPFESFVKKIGETIDLIEAAGYPYAPKQIATILYNCILKA